MSSDNYTFEAFEYKGKEYTVHTMYGLVHVYKGVIARMEDRPNKMVVMGKLENNDGSIIAAINLLDGKEVDSIIDHFDYFDTAWGMGLDFITEDVEKRYPKLANKILLRVEELIRRNGRWADDLEPFGGPDNSKVKWNQ